jgi:protein tyrosine phosphatase (PTP) superfamily phosphohydrolase (DUF442 family)
MMSHLSWFKAGGPTRGTPRRMPGRLGRLMAMAFIGSFACLEAGCRSGPDINASSCGSCGKCSACGFFARATNRILHRNRVYSDSTPVSNGVVEYGAPAGIAVPGGIPSYSSGGTMGTAPSNVTNPPGNPIELEPAPSAKPGATPSGPGATGSSGSGARATSYSTRRPGTSTALRSGRSLSSTPASSPEPTSRSAQASSNTSGGTAEGSLDDNFLDHLPPLGLPGEVTKSAASPPAPPAAPADPKTGAAPNDEPTAQRGDAPTEAEFALTIASEPAPETVSTAGAGTGIAHFAAVDLKLAGGSGPSEAGLSWLSEKGYRTLLDLRESPEVAPSFIADVSSRGLRYVALPVSLKALDPEHVARFNDEIASADARPLFFFDSDGSRAGALWYIRRVTVDRVDPQIARREAEQLGLVDKTAWLTATQYVETLKTAKADPGNARSSPRSQDGPATTSANPEATDRGRASSGRERTDAIDAPRTFQDFLDEVAATAERSSPKAANATPPERQSDERKRSDSAPSPSSDTMVWRPFAAMLLTGLSIPLAYWTRTLVPDLLSKARASLPAPAQRPRSLPRESGV